MESTDDSWECVAGYLANQLRGEFPFSYGSKINFKAKIAEDSDMDAFLIFAPSILEQEDFLDIEVGLDYKISIAGLYPIYSSEFGKIDELGLEDFWHHPKFDMYNVKRKRIA